VTTEDVPSIGISQGQGEGVSIMMNTTQNNSTKQASGSIHVAMDEEGVRILEHWVSNIKWNWMTRSL